jgi:hypothetical protein
MAGKIGDRTAVDFGHQRPKTGRKIILCMENMFFFFINIGRFCFVKNLTSTRLDLATVESIGPWCPISIQYISALTPLLLNEHHHLD